MSSTRPSQALMVHEGWITEIDTEKRTVEVTIGFGFPLKISYDILPAKSEPPKLGEKWIVHRFFGRWMLGAIIGQAGSAWTPESFASTAEQVAEQALEAAQEAIDESAEALNDAIADANAAVDTVETAVDALDAAVDSAVATITALQEQSDLQWWLAQ